jgi:hypothetical protein
VRLQPLDGESARKIAHARSLASAFSRRAVKKLAFFQGFPRMKRPLPRDPGRSPT